MRKKVKPVMEVLAEAKDLRLFGVCNTNPEQLVQKFRVHGVSMHNVVFLESVEHAKSVELDSELTYVCVSYRQAKQLFFRCQSGFSAAILVCDSALNCISVTTQFLDADATVQDGKLAWNFSPADNWHRLKDNTPFSCVPCIYDHTRALVSDCSQGSILKPFFTNVYKLPKEQQSVIKDMVVLTLVEKDAAQAEEILSEFFDKTLSPEQKKVFMKLLFVEQRYLAPLVELRPYALAGADPREYPAAEIAARYEVDSYELNYFLQTYKKVRRTNTVAMEERFFRKGDSLRAKSAKRKQTVASS